MTTLYNLCAVCHVSAPKYKCPACNMRTCSLACSRGHKEQTSCTGAVDPAKFVPRNELLSSPTTLNRDYNFLLSVDRRLALGKRTADEMGPQRKHQRIYTKNGVRVRSLPAGMQKARMNKSGWNNRRKSFYWTVEWIFDHQRVFKEIADSEILEDVALRLFPVLEQTQFQVYMKRIDCPANKQQLIPLDNRQTLSSQIEGKSVIEFPTFVIIKDQLPDGYIIAGNDNSDDSSSEESDSSSSESESDSPPEEASSKGRDRRQSDPVDDLKPIDDQQNQSILSELVKDAEENGRTDD
jgi:hypothetical protein